MQQPIFHPSSEWNNEDKVGRLLKTIAQNILVFTFGLFPILFLPLPYVSVGYSKYILLCVGVVVAIVFYLLSILRDGRLDFQLPLGVVALWAVAFIALAAAIFSGDLTDSLWGDGLNVGSAAFTLVLATVVTASLMLSSSKAIMMRLYTLLSLSALILAAFHFLRIILGVNKFTFNVFDNTTATPLGDWNSLGIFFGLAILLCLVALEQLPLTRVGKIIVVVLSVLSLGVLAVVNFKLVWFVLALVCFMVLLYSLVRHRFADPQLRLVGERTDSLYTIIISLLVLIVAGTFILSGSWLGGYIANWSGVTYVEVRPSTTATIDIARNVLREDLLLGVGPNRFVDAWRLYKDPAINETVFWSSNFEVGSSYFLTNLIQTGVLGIISWIVFLTLVLVSGARILLRTLRVDSFWYFIGLASLVSILYLWGITFMYVPHPSIMILTAVCTGVFFATYSVLVPGRTYTISIEQHRNFGFVLIVFVVLILSFTTGGLYILTKQFVANQQFSQALATVKPGDTLESLELRIAQAFQLSKNDLFVRQVAVYQLFQLNSLIRLTEPSDMEIQAFARSRANGIVAVDLATSLDNSEPLNWQVAGQLHSTLLMAGMKEAYDVAHTAFTKAKALDPQNPVLPLLLAELELRNNNPTGARVLAEEAVRLRPRYTEAVYLLAQLDTIEGNVEAAILRTQNVIQLEPQNPARWYQLGILYAATENVEGAVSAFEAAVRLNPQYANARYFLALGYYVLGRKEESLRELYIVRDFNPDNVTVASLIARLEKGEPLILNLAETSPVAEPGETADGASNLVAEDLKSDLVTPVNVIPESGETEQTESASTTSEMPE